MYILVMIINHCYWEHNYEYYCARQIEKEALKSHSQEQGKVFISRNAITSQNKVNSSLVASFTKQSLFKSSLSSASKKQSNSPQVDLSSKLASNGKLTSDKCKKHLKNNLCLYCGAKDYKLNFCSKKQTTVTPKGHSTLATTDPLTAASEKPLEK